MENHPEISASLIVIADAGLGGGRKPWREKSISFNRGREIEVLPDRKRN